MHSSSVYTVGVCNWLTCPALYIFLLLQISRLGAYKSFARIIKLAFEEKPFCGLNWSIFMSEGEDWEVLGNWEIWGGFDPKLFTFVGQSLQKSFNTMQKLFDQLQTLLWANCHIFKILQERNVTLTKRTWKRVKTGKRKIVFFTFHEDKVTVAVCIQHSNPRIGRC